MNFDSIEKTGLELKTNVEGSLNDLHKSFESKIKPERGVFERLSENVDTNITNWLQVSGVEITSQNRVFAYSTIKEMFTGTELAKGVYSKSIDSISKMKIDPNNAYSNTRQHAGFAAEVISTAKENIVNKYNKTGIETIRTDDAAYTRPELGYTVNDEYVDKIRVDSTGTVIERIQTKFVGKDAKECLNHLTSKDYEKYLDPTKVDKIEIPKDYYDEIKKDLLPKKIQSLENQIKKTEELGKTEDAAKHRLQLEKCKRIDEMLEKSLVDNREAEMSIKHPKLYKTMTMAKEVAKAGNETGLKSAEGAATVTFAISTIDNVTKVVNGEIEAEEAVVDIVKDTGVATAVGYATGFATGAISTAMQSSGSTLIQSVGGSCLPAATVAFAVQSFEDVNSFASGETDVYEFSEALGENAVNVAGGTAGAAIGAAVGGTLGTVVAPGVGTAVGAKVGGVVGGMIGCAIASEGYTAVAELIKENEGDVSKAIATETEALTKQANELANKAQELSSNVIDYVAENVPDALDSVKDSFVAYAKEMKLPFSLV